MDPQKNDLTEQEELKIRTGSSDDEETLDCRIAGGWKGDTGMGNAGRNNMNNMCCCCCMCISGRFLRPGALLCSQVPVYRK